MLYKVPCTGPVMQGESVRCLHLPSPACPPACPPGAGCPAAPLPPPCCPRHHLPRRRGTARPSPWRPSCSFCPAVRENIRATAISHSQFPSLHPPNHSYQVEDVSDQWSGEVLHTEHPAPLCAAASTHSVCPATPLLDQAQVAVEVRVDSIQRLVVSCLWLGKPEEHLRSKMWEKNLLHL